MSVAAPVAIAAVVLIAVASIARLNLSTTPNPGSSASDATQPPASHPTALDPAAQTLLEDTRVAMIDPRAEGGGQWLVGTLGTDWAPLPYTAGDTVVRTDANRVIAAVQDDGLRILDVTNRADVRVLYEGPPPTSTVLAGSGPGDQVVVVGVDLGVMVVVDQTSKLLVEPESTSEPTQRGQILWSQNGMLAASPLCTQLTCATAVIDLTSDRSWTVPDLVPLAISNEVVIGYRSEGDRALLALGIESLAVVSVDFGPIVAPYSATTIGDNRFLVSGEDKSGSLVFVIADASGTAATVVRTDPSGAQVLYQDWRSDRFAILGPRSGLGSAALKAVPFDVLDLRAPFGTVQVGVPALPKLP